MSNLSIAVDNRAAIAEIKRLYDLGVINRVKAQQLAQPVLDRINARGAEIAKKRGQKPYKLDFISAMRNSY